MFVIAYDSCYFDLKLRGTNFGIDFLVFFSYMYCSLIIESLSEQSRCSDWRWTPIIQDCKITMEKFVSCKLEKINRASNSWAHNTTRWAAFISEKQALISVDSKQGLPIADSSKSGSIPENPSFFEVFVTNSNCLRIPFEAAMHFIPDEHTKSKSQRTLQITDHLNTQRDISYNWFEEENAFILIGNWSKYADKFKLCPMDKVRFTKLEPTLCFLTQIFRRPKDQPLQISLPKFLPVSFIIQIKLTPVDVLYGRLAISGERVRSEFPEIEEINGKYQMLKLTDCNDKNWYLKLVYAQVGDRYMMMGGWERLVKEHEVAAEDFISFYEPDRTSSNKHFLIHFEKKRRNDCDSSGGSKDDVEGVAQQSSICSFGLIVINSESLK